MGIADGPSEVHKVTIAKQVLSKYSASSDPHIIAFTKFNMLDLKAKAVAKATPVLRAAGVDISWIQRGHGLNSML